MIDKYFVRVAPLVALLLILSGCMGGSDNQATNQDTGGAGVTKATSAEAVVATTQAGGQVQATTTLKTSGGLAASITDLASAMTSGVGYKCTYSYNGVASEGWVKGQKYLFKSTVNKVVTNALSDGVWMFIWEEGRKDGYKFNIAQMKQVGEAQESGYQDMNKVASGAANVDCKPDLSADSKFKPPSDIQFQDMGELLKQIQNIGPGGRTP